MLYLLHVHWLFPFGAVALGVIVGWMTRLPHFTRWTDRWVRLVAAVVAIATVVALTRLVPGRAGYWLELAAAFSIVYFIGCFVGWALRDLADFQVADAPDAADPSYLFRRNFAGLAGLEFYMRHADAGGPGQGQQPRPLFGSYVAGQLNIPRAGYVFPTTAPTTGAAALVRGETTPSGQRKHWSWPGAAVASAGTPIYRFADDAFDAIKGGYVFPSAPASNPIGDAKRQGTTTTGLRRHWSWPSATGGATGAAAPIAATRTDFRAADASPAVASPARAAATAGFTPDRAVSRDATPTVGQTGRSAAAASPGGETQARPTGGTSLPPGVSASPDVGSRSAEPGNAGTAARAGSQAAAAASAPRASIPSAGGSSSAQTSGGGTSPSTPSAAAAIPDANATQPSPDASASGAAQGGAPPAGTSPAPMSAAAAPPKGSQVAGAPGEGASGAPTESPQAGAAAAAVDQRPSSSPSGTSPSPKQAAGGGLAQSGSPSPESGVSAPTATSGAGATRVPGSAGAGATSSSRPAAASPATSASSGTSSGPAGAGTTLAQSRTETGGTASARAAPASAGGGLAAAAPPTPSATTAPSAAGSADPPKIESLPNEELHAGERPEGLVAARNNRADDLKWIKGIGPQNEGRLHGLGVWHFDQIAAWTPDNVKWVGSYLAFHGRIDREKWIEQATQLARGETTDFSKRVASGKVSTSRDDGGHGQSNVDADILSRPRKR